MKLLDAPAIFLNNDDLGLFILLGLVIIGLYIAYLLTLQKTLKSISIENRMMPPSQVWFILIPLFGVLWQFKVVKNISKSIAAECSLRNIKIKAEEPAYAIGMAMCILNFLIYLPYFKMLAIIPFLVCWIVYWSRVMHYKDLLPGFAPNDKGSAQNDG